MWRGEDIYMKHPSPHFFSVGPEDKHTHRLNTNFLTWSGRPGSGPRGSGTVSCGHAEFKKGTATWVASVPVPEDVGAFLVRLGTALQLPTQYGNGWVTWSSKAVCMPLPTPAVRENNLVRTRTSSFYESDRHPAFSAGREMASKGGFTRRKLSNWRQS